MCSLELLPNEIFIQITNNLCTEDLQVCRLVSSLVRERIDTLYNTNMCVILNEKSERDFSAKKKPPLLPPFTRMKIENVSYFSNRSNKTNNKNAISLRKEYFQCITELDISEFVPKYYFHQIMQLTRSLRILKLSSAVLGGSDNLFEDDIQNGTSFKHNSMICLRRALPQTLIQNMLQREQNQLALQESHKNKKWRKLTELHIRIDYVCPSTPNFSPHWLVENLRRVRHLPVPKLNAFTLSVEKSKDGEMFYFTINSLLDIIPVQAYSSLKNVSIMSPKCRPINQREYLEKRHINKQDFSEMQLSELTVRISEGHKHAIPEDLMAILEAQQQPLKTVSIEGIRNAHVLKLMN